MRGHSEPLTGFNLSSVDPEELALRPLRDNGGPTATRAVGQSSIAVD